MPNLTTVALGIAAFVCLTLGVADWWLYIVSLYRPQPGQDWMVFYTAAQAYLHGDVPILWHVAHFMTAIETRFGGWMSKPMTLHPWVYPPHFLLLFLPFALLPPGASFFTFVGVTFGGLLLTLTLCMPTRRDWLLGAAVVAISPAAAYTFSVGQNAFLTGALLIGGCSMLNRRPVLAGILFGILTFKPQLWLMVPIALLAARDWKALVSTVVTGVALGAASLAAFGFDLWVHSLDFLLGNSPFYAAWVTASRLTGTSVYACAAILGADPHLSWIIQAVACVAAAAATWTAFRHVVDLKLRLAVFLAASLLAAPHSANYDFILLTVAAVLVVQYARQHAPMPGLAVVAGVAWLCPIVNPPDWIWWSAYTPVVVCGFIIATLVRGWPSATCVPSPHPVFGSPVAN